MWVVDDGGVVVPHGSVVVAGGDEPRKVLVAEPDVELCLPERRRVQVVEIAEEHDEVDFLGEVLEDLEAARRRVPDRP
jgi:hypothetical protein